MSTVFITEECLPFSFRDILKVWISIVPYNHGIKSVNEKVTGVPMIASANMIRGNRCGNQIKKIRYKKENFDRNGKVRILQTKYSEIQY